MKIVYLLLLFPISLSAQNNTNLFDAYMKAETDLYHFNGNVLVAKNGKIIYQKAFGHADYDAKTTLDNNSIFDCGSIAKEFTAMGILLLKDKGVIGYADTLRKFFPELPYNKITIQQMLTHTSGIPDGFGLVAKYFDHDKIATNEDFIRLLATEKPPALFQPGEDMMYSGTAFILLASIIEKLSGQSYVAYMDNHVFKPLGMTHTQVAIGPRSTKDIPGLAYGFIYSDSSKRYVKATSLKSGWTTYLAGLVGEGMIISSTADLLKWDRALRNHSLLSAETQSAMLTKQAEKKTYPLIQYGYGIRVGKNYFGNYIFHNGGYPGYIAMLIRYPDTDITAVVLSNNESRSDFIADGLVAITLDKNFVMPYVHKEISMKANLDRFTGKYMMQLAFRPPYLAPFPVEIVSVNDKLFIQRSGMDKELKPESETKFFFADGTDQQVEFEIDKGGKPVKAWHIAWGLKRELTRMTE
ncbi:MAG TPA: serine hydrolase [Cyclobacteriaceae bacterium]|nr:serine hydrolase [Cyclobacteriaceae bacterium]